MDLNESNWIQIYPNGFHLILIDLNISQWIQFIRNGLQIYLNESQWIQIHPMAPNKCQLCLMYLDGL